MPNPLTVEDRDRVCGPSGIEKSAVSHFTAKATTDRTSRTAASPAVMSGVVRTASTARKPPGRGAAFAGMSRWLQRPWWDAGSDAAGSVMEWMLLRG